MSTDADSSSAFKKRAACDRCRGQKTRCMRRLSNTDLACIRCLRAGAQCISSPSLPMGRPPRDGRSRRSTTGLSHPSLISTGQAARPHPSATPGLPTGNDDLVAASVAVDNDFMDMECLNNFGSHDWDSRPADPRLTATSGTPDHTWSWSLPEARDMISDTEPSNLHARSDNNVPLAAVASSIVHEPRRTETRVITPVTTINSIHDGEIGHQSIQPTSQHGQHTHGSVWAENNCAEDTNNIETLSRMALDLNNQLLELSSDADQSASDSQHGGSNNHTTRILNSSQELLSIVLRTLPQNGHQNSGKDSTKRFSPSQSMHGSYRKAQIPPNQVSEDLAVTSGYSSSTDDSMLLTPSSPGSISGPDSISKPDAPLILLSITCYIQIIRVYNALFFQIIHQLSEKPTSSQAPTIFLGLNIAAFPIQSRSIQTITFLQVATHILSHVEILLGIPKEHRVVKSESRSRGILVETGLVELFRSMAKQDHNQGSKSLREKIRRIKHILKTSSPL